MAQTLFIFFLITLSTLLQACRKQVVRPGAHHICRISKLNAMRKVLCIVFVIGLPPFLKGQTFKSGFILKRKFHPCTEATDGICPHRFEKDANTAFRCFQLGKYDEVGYYANKAIGEGERIGEDVSWLHYLNAQLNAEQGLYRQASDEMSLNQVTIGNFTWYNKGIYALKSGNHRLAVTAFTEHLNTSGDLQHESHWGKGIAYLNLALPDSALNSFYDALSYRDQPEVRLGIVQVLVMQGKRMDALTNCRAAVRKFPLHQKLREALKNLLSNQTSGMFRHFYTSLLSSMTFVRQDINKANHLVERGYRDRAQRLYNSILRKQPANLEAHLGLVNVMLLEHKNQEARIKLQSLLTLFPAETRLHEAIGLIDYSENRWDSAIVHLAKASINPQSPLTYNGYLAAGTILYAQKQVAVAYKLFEKAATQSSDNSWAHAGMAMCLLSLNEIRYNASLRQEARMHLIFARLKAPADGTLLLYSGLVEYYSKHYALARFYFNRAAAVGLENTQLFNAWAMLENTEEHFEKSFELMDKARSLSPNNAELFLNSGVMQFNYAAYLHDKDSSANLLPLLHKMHMFYDTAVVLGMDSNMVNVNRGVAYSEIGVYDTALLWYSKVHSADTVVAAGAVNNSGVINALLAQNYAAEEFFGQANSLDASNRLTLIDDNIRVLHTARVRSKKEYTYVFFYVLPVASFRPELSEKLRTPDGIPNASCPNEVRELHFYDVECDAHRTGKLIRIKGQKHRKEKIRKTRIDACW